MQSKNKVNIGYRYNQVPHLTQDTTWESDKNTRKYHIQESQEASPFQAGDRKAAMNKHETKMIHKRSTASEAYRDA